MSKIVNGVSLQPKSGAAPKLIVLLLHGYGSNGNDLIAFAPMWQDVLPDALFLAPHGPQRCAMMAAGYQWFGLSNFDPVALARDAASAAPAIHAFIDRKLAQYGLNDDALAMVGFSQGTMMALQVGLRRRTAPGAIVGYSGLFTGGADLAANDRPKTPILLVHGSADPVVPIDALHRSKAALDALDYDVQTHVAPGLGHTIDPQGLNLGKAFIARALKGA